MSTNIQKNQITEGIIWRQLLLFFFPILLGTFFQQLYNTIDSVIVGQFVGKEALAAVGGSSAQIVAFVVGFFTGLSSGASVTIAQFFGAKDSRSANKGLHTAYAIAAFGGLILTVSGIILTPFRDDEYACRYCSRFRRLLKDLLCRNHFRPHLQHGIGNTARHRRFQTSALLFDRLLHHQHRA